MPQPCVQSAFRDARFVTPISSRPTAATLTSADRGIKLSINQYLPESTAMHLNPRVLIISSPLQETFGATRRPNALSLDKERLFA